MDTEAAMIEPAIVADGASTAVLRWEQPADERAAFVEAMSRAAAGVTVVATAGEEGRFGQTVSAMCSVSADPPLLLACINRKSACGKAILRHRVFSVNVLRADQQRVAQVFAGRPRSGEPYDFGCAVWEEEATGAPLLVGAAARFDCELAAVHEAASHRIFVGRVVASSAGNGTPLIYAHRGYGELLLFPRHHPESHDVPAGFVGDEPADAFEDLWETEDWG
jgi:flavin reductase